MCSVPKVMPLLLRLATRPLSNRRAIGKACSPLCPCGWAWVWVGEGGFGVGGGGGREESVTGSGGFAFFDGNVAAEGR